MSSNPEDGSTTNSTSQNPTFCCSEGPEEPIPKPDYHLLDLFLLQIPSYMLDIKFQPDIAFTLIFYTVSAGLAFEHG